MARDNLGMFVIGALVGAALTYVVLTTQPFRSQWLERNSPTGITAFRAALFP